MFYIDTRYRTILHLTYDMSSKFWSMSVANDMSGIVAHNLSGSGLSPLEVRRAEMLQEFRKMRFEEVYHG
jgi:hypothetical protein